MDPGLPVGGGADPRGGGGRGVMATPTYNFAKISKKNHMELRKYLALGQRVPGALLGSATEKIVVDFVAALNSMKIMFLSRFC